MFIHKILQHIMLKRILPRYYSDLKEDTVAEHLQKKIMNASRYINQVLDNIIIEAEETNIKNNVCNYNDPECGIKDTSHVPTVIINLSEEDLKLAEKELMKQQEEDLKYELREIKILE